jgi:hypothetical protein
MDYQQPPSVIVVTSVEKHDVREEEIERVSRLLCRADGCNPDADMRCRIDASGMTATCNAIAMSYPSYLEWNRYREQASSLLRELFSPATFEERFWK